MAITCQCLTAQGQYARLLAKEVCMSNEVTVELGVTLNIGNFESVRIGVSETRTVPEGMPFREAKKKLYEEVDAFLSEKIEEARNDIK